MKKRRMKAKVATITPEVAKRMLERQDPYALELGRQPEIQPYLDALVAKLRDDEAAWGEAFQRIRGLPLEKRYISRIVLALQWAFADYDSANVALDIAAGYTEADIKKLDGGHLMRPMQLALFLKMLYGVDAAREILAKALEWVDGDSPESRPS